MPGSGPDQPPSPAAMHWRRRFADYKAALAAHQQAQTVLQQLQGRLTRCTTSAERTALDQGVAVAALRVPLTAKALAKATGAFTQGRSVLEAVWDAPDEI